MEEGGVSVYKARPDPSAPQRPRGHRCTRSPSFDNSISKEASERLGGGLGCTQDSVAQGWGWGPVPGHSASLLARVCPSTQWAKTRLPCIKTTRQMSPKEAEIQAIPLLLPWQPLQVSFAEYTPSRHPLCFQSDALTGTLSVKMVHAMPNHGQRGCRLCFP